LCFELFVVRPHANDFDRVLFIERLIDEPVLNVDAARICSGKNRRRISRKAEDSDGILAENLEQLLRFVSKTAAGDFAGVLLSLGCDGLCLSCVYYAQGKGVWRYSSPLRNVKDYNF
jgi:hypothetical protein